MSAVQRRIAIVTPVLNDWQSLGKLLSEIAKRPVLQNDVVTVVAVDDGSLSVETPGTDTPLGPVESVRVVRLRANQGHQRAIALGLAYVYRDLDVDVVIVMDSDGEDMPEELDNLIARHESEPRSVIVAHRQRRSEGLAFRVFYQFYKALFLLLTGKPISFGNFSLIPFRYLSNVIYNGGVWNNYAATVLRCRLPIAFVPTLRGARYFGSSSMNFTSLMVHGMSAIAVFSDLVVGRIIMGLAIAAAAFLIAVLGVFLVYFATDIFVPGYATNVILFLANMLLNALLLGVLVILSLLSTRTQADAVPSELLLRLVSTVETIEYRTLVGAE